MNSKRLDIYLYEQGFFTSRSLAQDAIKEQRILVNGKIITKPGYKIENESVEVIQKELQFASRGGLKLYAALQSFHIDLTDLVVMDIGASTGGFSDVCLQSNAQFVYALDSGKDQLIERLKNDPRVKNMEGVNCRYLKKDYFLHTIRFVCMDVSFISIKLIVPSILEVLDQSWEGVFLIKPQFEAGKALISKNGIVKDKKVHKKILDDFLLYFQEVGLSVYHLKKSSVIGRDGNQEYVIHVGTICKKKFFDTLSIVKEGD